MNPVALDVTTPAPEPAALRTPAWRDRIAWLRGHRLVGTTIVLEPYAPAHGEALRQLRNRPENQFNLAQGGELTAEQQAGWGRAYAARDNDLCWVVLTPAREFAGATRLYDIDGDAGSAEKGGLVLREELARAAPLALEAELMLLWIALRWIGLREVITQVRPENQKMRSINDRLGFQPAGETTLRAVPYLRSRLATGGFDPAPLAAILAHWKKRHVS